jgi:hypothetical protein
VVVYVKGLYNTSMSTIEYYPYSGGEAVTVASIKAYLENQIKISETNMLDSDRQFHMLLGCYNTLEELPESVPFLHKQEARHCYEEMIRSSGELNALKEVLSRFK